MEKIKMRKNNKKFWLIMMVMTIVLGGLISVQPLFAMEISHPDYLSADDRIYVGEEKYIPASMAEIEKRVKIIKILDATNVDKEKEFLPPTLYIRIKEWGMKINIIEPKFDYKKSTGFYKQSKISQGQVKLNERRELIGYVGGQPFADPKTGDEVAFNWKLYFQGDVPGWRYWGQIIDPKNRVRKIGGAYERFPYWGRCDLPEMPNPEKLEHKELALILYPGDVAGTGLLTVRYQDSEKDDDMWFYIPTARRLRRYSSAARCDSYAGSDVTWDDYLGGAFKTQDMNYKLLGKKEYYIPRHQVLYTEKIDFINPVNSFWEKAPVYVVETIAKDPNYIYSKRIMYIDAHDYFGTNYAEMYDKKGHLWKSYEYAFNPVPEEYEGAGNTPHCVYAHFIDHQLKRATFWPIYDTHKVSKVLTSDDFTPRGLEAAGR